MGVYDRIKAALKESRAGDLDDQTVAVMAAVAQHQRAKVANGEPTLFETPDDDRAERLIANRLSELTMLTEGQCRTLSYALTHTLVVDGFVLGRRRSMAADEREAEQHAAKDGGVS
jgi:hypothetical protein